MGSRGIYTLLGVLAATLCIVAWQVYRVRDRIAQEPPNTIAIIGDETQVTPVIESDLYLPEKEREFLWECEHRGNLLSETGWRSVSNAIVHNQHDELVAILADGFRGKVPASDLNHRFKDNEISAQRSSPAANLLQRQEFAKWLLDLRRPFISKPSISIATLSLAPRSQMDLTEDWQGKCRMRTSGQQTEKVSEIVVTFDFTITSTDRDKLDAAGWWSHCEITQIDSSESHEFLMREVAADRGFLLHTLHDNWNATSGQRVVSTGGVYLCDFNRDGYTDVLVTEPFSPRSTMLYRGLSEGHFEDATYEVRLPNLADADHALFADIDNDGWEDLLILGRGVFRNVEGTRFQDATRATNLTQLIIAGGLEGVSATVVDFDRDGLIDIYVTRADVSRFNQGSWIDGKSGAAANNQLLRNLGNGMFEDVTKASGTSGGRRSTFTASWLDANDDSWPDVYVIHEFGAGALLVNQQDGTFVEQQIAEHSDDFGSMGLVSGDIDNDGQVDLYVSNMYSKAGNRVMDNLSSEYYDTTTMAKLRRMVAGSQLHVNTGGGRFEPTSNREDIAAVKQAINIALVDLNNDGWLDIHATCGFMSKDRGKPDG